ncbi:NAD(P)-dependent alcohol dehydrogenase [Actinocorallia sp. A-T 12471]|uniref:NAD(P)-dependent alcohol dehydrogenase n=1 Tax=Actinocorallia sp. A-T 12471 TaxID=3089813 RepID=UPI0029CFA9B6|nr:NAD(P)-dependent alcohol dehydrogenase [Actinocorallia sp. A-T 12471]MDX6744689.1 NAD(P)-dependent alcohol dehydrogenase [Actinocorallia sp. A-T 12471]
MSEMQALMFDRYGPPDVLYAGRVKRPSADRKHVLVRVRAVSVNGGELPLRAGRLKPFSETLLRGWPKRLGLDFAGEVAELAEPVAGLEVGTPVWGVMPRNQGFGSAAEYIAAPPSCLSRAPAGLGHVEAAALPVGTTAITALRDKARLRAGERLLVRGGAGGVGNVAVQLGKAYGAHVTALAGGANLDLVRSLGADVALDYTTVSPADLGPFDVVLDTVGTDLPAWHRTLGRSGRMVTIAFDLARPFTSLASIALSVRHGSRRIRFFSGNPKTDLLDDLTRLVESGDLRPVVDTVHPLADAANAHRALEAGGTRGKHIITLP